MAEADDLDRASELTQALTDIYVAGTRRKAQPEQEQGQDGSWPITDCECGEPLGLRMTLGKIRCIECQQDLEQERRCSR